jgi:hypothetical protein
MKRTLLSLGILLSFVVITQAQAPRKVVLEDYTGAWCGYCPRGTTIMNDLIAGNSNVIGVANHIGDVLENNYTYAIKQGLNVTSYPNGSIDRFKFPAQAKVGFGTNYWASYTSQRLALTSPCNVGIASNYNSATRVVDITVDVEFVAGVTAPVGGDLRLSCVLLQDGITGVPQQNYMGQGCSAPSPSSPWYTYPCVIPNFVHDHTARINLASNNWGDPTVIPTEVSAGESFSKSFTYTIPPSWDASKMKVLAFVTRHHPTDAFQRDMLNANQTTGLNSVTGIEVISSGNLVSSHSAFPNPAVDYSNIQFQLNKTDHVSVRIYNALGQVVSTLIDRNLTPGLHSFIWDTETIKGVPAHNGLYIYEIRSSEGSLTGRIMLNR